MSWRMFQLTMFDCRVECFTNEPWEVIEELEIQTMEIRTDLEGFAPRKFVSTAGHSCGDCQAASVKTPKPAGK